MKYTQRYIPSRLIRRYKRFLADVQLDNGEVITVHTPNTGSMLGCAEPGFTAWIYDSDNPKRKYRWSWLLVENHEGVRIGINTALANDLVEEGIRGGVIAELQGYRQIRQEVKSTSGASRFDLFLVAGENQKDCYVEVKSVTAKAEDGLGIFPDAISARGTKHLLDLREMVAQGFRAVLLFCVQRDDISALRGAYEIDTRYAETLKEVSQNGVEIYAYVADLTPQEVKLVHSIPVVFPN